MKLSNRPPDILVKMSVKSSLSQQNRIVVSKVKFYSFCSLLNHILLYDKFPVVVLHLKKNILKKYGNFKPKHANL
jgi:hypothetical protein